MADFVCSVARLLDPTGAAKDARQLKELQDKVSECMTRMFQKPGNGGNPFLFALSGPRPHFLATKLGDGRALDTAATDGRLYMWNPGFLADLEKHQVTTVMSHEAYHTLFFHTTRERAAGKHKEDWNWATDYAVNAVIIREHEKAQEEAKGMGKVLPELWGGRLGTPVTLDELLKWIDGKLDHVGTPGQTHMYADASLLDRSPESVYAEIQLHKQNSPRRCKACHAMSINPRTGKSMYGDPPYKPGACPKCGAEPDSNCLGGGWDSHMDSALSKDQVMSAMMEAAGAVKAMGRGDVPAEIEEALAELQRPTLSPHDIIVHAMQRKALDVGSNNDWTRFERRAQHIYERDPATGEWVPRHRLYTPKKYDFSPTFVALLDTSGSMSDLDVANGLKELRAVAGMVDCEGWVVPCDAKPYWDKKTRVTCDTDVQRVRLAGRGGTVFEDFFRELPNEIGVDVDVVIIITDGDCGAHELPVSLRPSAETLWIITNKRDFHPAWGRVIQLDPARH